MSRTRFEAAREKRNAVKAGEAAGEIADSMNGVSTKEGLARAYAKTIGASGRRGGWIYSASGRPICQGWFTFYCKFRADIAKEDDHAISTETGKAH